MIHFACAFENARGGGVKLAAGWAGRQASILRRAAWIANIRVLAIISLRQAAFYHLAACRPQQHEEAAVVPIGRRAGWDRWRAASGPSGPVPLPT